MSALISGNSVTWCRRGSPVVTRVAASLGKLRWQRPQWSGNNCTTRLTSSEEPRDASDQDALFVLPLYVGFFVAFADSPVAVALQPDRHWKAVWRSWWNCAGVMPIDALNQRSSFRSRQSSSRIRRFSFRALSLALPAASPGRQCVACAAPPLRADAPVHLST